MNELPFRTLAECRVCRSKDLRQFFDLGAQPLANSLPTSPDENELFFPLSLAWCGECSLVQLEQTVDPKVLFSHYVWVTGTSKGANTFSETFYEELIRRAPTKTPGYVLEVASNDGTFLKPFQRNGHEVLGIDPAENVVRMANEAGVPTRAVFWGSAAARTLVQEKGKAKMVFARNVMAHVANTRDFISGISGAIHEDGVIAIESHYGRRILEDLQYDSIYHEHLCYYTLKSTERLLNDAGLHVFDVLAGPISGGALIVFARKSKGDASPEVARWRNEESAGKTNEFPSWQGFRDRAFAHKEKLLRILEEAGKSGSIIGWGASARSSTLLNFCGIDSAIMPLIIDLNPLKQGRFTAGTHIPVVKPETALAENPSLVFVTGWNFGAEIIDMLRNKYNYQGPCLVPLPREPRVIAN